MELRRLRHGDLAAARVSGRAGARHILVPLHDLGMGGSERIAVRLASRWAHDGRRVTLVCGSREGPLAALVGPGVEVAACEPAIRRGPGGRAALGRAVAARVGELRPDLVFLPGNHHWPVAPHLARVPPAMRPVLVAQISNPLVRADRRGVRRWLFEARTRRRLAGVDAAVALSEAVVADADRILRSRVTCAIALPALDDAAPGATPAPGGPPLILAAGRLAAQKRFDLAIRAFARADLPDATLAIVGEGPWRRRLERLAARLGVAHRVALPGYAADLRPWLDRARLLLLTSDFEGYGAVIVEALAAGRPVVATDCTPAVAELLGVRDRGRVAPGGDVDALARALESVLAAPQPNPAGLAASVARFRIGPVAAAYLRRFDALADARQGGGQPLRAAGAAREAC